MDARISVVGAGPELVGFRLAGVSDVIDIDEKTGEEAFEKLSEKQGILLLTKTASEKLGVKTEKLRTQNIVLVLPEAGEENNNIKKLIKDTVGFELKK